MYKFEVVINIIIFKFEIDKSAVKNIKLLKDTWG